MAPKSTSMPAIRRRGHGSGSQAIQPMMPNAPAMNSPAATSNARSVTSTAPSESTAKTR